MLFKFRHLLVGGIFGHTLTIKSTNYDNALIILKLIVKDSDNWILTSNR